MGPHRMSWRSCCYQRGVRGSSTPRASWYVPRSPCCRLSSAQSLPPLSPGPSRRRGDDLGPSGRLALEAIREVDLKGKVVTLDALHTQREAA
jgi:hypothetical protein